MFRYKLNYTNLIKRTIHPNFKIKETEQFSIIQTCIDYFNSEIQWDNMFTLPVAINRINNGDKMFIGLYNDEIIGYCWLHQNTDLNYYIYNIFIKTTDTPRNYGATDMVYFVIENYTNGFIEMDIDEWNIKSQHMANKLGFILINN